MGRNKETVRTTCFRFNMENPEHEKAWNYLHSFNKDEIKSGNVAVITAVNDYFERMQKSADDPYFENRQREERFVEQIVAEVGKVFTAEMPKFLASLMLSLSTGYPTHPQQTTVVTSENTENTDYSDIDLDFIGG